MGEVFRARDTRLKRDVAVKVLPEAVRKDADRLRRFEQEARATGALNHPNVLAVYDVGEHEGAPFLVTELLEGQTLRERLSEGPVPWRKALDWGRQIAAGLAAAHDKGIVHRDLKPENLFVTKDGRLKILDFGLAKEIGGQASPDDSTQTATEPGAVLGTAGYMAPEQLRGRPADTRSDIFAFGAVLYETLSGKRAFEGETMVERSYAILNHEPPAFAEAGMEVPAAVERLVRRCLEKAPEERLQSARDVGYALEAMGEVSGSSGASRGSAAGLPARPSSARSLLLAGAAVALVGAGMTVGSLWQRTRLAAAGNPSAQAAASASRSAPLPATWRPLTFRRGTVRNARFAHDGKSVLYGAAWDNGPEQLFQTIPGPNPESRPVVEPGYELLAVSRDGELAVRSHARRLSWFARLGTLSLVHLGGGAPRVAVEDVTAADFLPDGKLVAARRLLDPKARERGRSRVEWPAGTPVYETEGLITHLRVSPQGERVAFLEHETKDNDDGRVVVIERDRGHRSLGPKWAGCQGLAWSPSGEEIWLAATQPTPEGFDGRTLRAVDLQGNARAIQEAPSSLVLQDVATDGRLLVAATDSSCGIVAKASKGVERDLTWLGSSALPTMSADGQLMAHGEQRASGGVPVATYFRRMDGSPAVRIVDGQAYLSPDGQWLATIQYPGWNAMRLVPTGPGEPTLLAHGPVTNYLGFAYWFPDSRRLLLWAETATGSRAFVQDVPAGDPAPLAIGSLSLDDAQPVSPDGKLVATRDAEGHRQLEPLTGGPAMPLPGIGPEDGIAAWTADGRALFVQRGGRLTAAPAVVDRYEVASGRAQPWRSFDLPAPVGDRFINVNAIVLDGDAYAYGYMRISSELYLVTLPSP